MMERIRLPNGFVFLWPGPEELLKDFLMAVSITCLERDSETRDYGLRGGCGLATKLCSLCRLLNSPGEINAQLYARSLVRNLEEWEEAPRGSN